MSIFLLLLLSIIALATSYETGACCSRRNCLSLSSTPEQCKEDYNGVFAGVGSLCADCVLPRPCCIEGNDGQTCATSTPFECETYGGVHVQSCASTKSCVYGKYAPTTTTTTAAASIIAVIPAAVVVPVHETHGACCVNSQCRDDVDLATCSGSSGRFYGIGTECGDESVQCGGGCCHSEHGCRVVNSRESCSHSAYETYLGDGVGCSLETCGGACCRASGPETCEIVSPKDCLARNGDTFLGLGSSSCVACEGACCNLGNMLCTDSVDHTKCRQSDNKKFHGAGSRCADLDSCGGACCARNGEHCLVASTREQCIEDFKGTYAGDGEPCTDSVCNGACCKMADAKCLNDVSFESCKGGRFNGPQSVCTTETCGGACCQSATQCKIASSEAECNTFNSHWAGFGVGCSAKACSRSPGACCLKNNVNPCVMVDTQEMCEGIDGTWQGEGKNCPRNSNVEGSMCYTRPIHSNAVNTVGGVKAAPQKQRETVQRVQHQQYQPQHVIAAKKIAARNAHDHTTGGTPGDLIGACCSFESECVVNNALDCEADGGFFRGSDTDCDDEAVCARCLPCLLGDDETGHCPLRQYDSLDTHSHHIHHGHRRPRGGFNHAHDVHHRNDACEDPQLCVSNYGRCLVQSVRRRDTQDLTRPFVCGGVDAEHLACAAEYNDGTGRCGVGVCVREPQFGNSQNTICVNLREYPCSCRCFDDSKISCGEAHGTVYNDRNRNEVADVGEPGIPGVTVGIYIDNSNFTVPPLEAPLASRVTDEEGHYTFDGLFETRYHTVVLSVPDGFSFPAAPLTRTFDVRCPHRRRRKSSSSSSSDDDDSSTSTSESDSTSTSHSSNGHGDDDDSVIRGSGDDDDDSSQVVFRKMVRAGGVLSSVQSAAHLALEQDFFIYAVFSIRGRVLFDTNQNDMDDGPGTEPGIGGALIRARLHPTMDIQQTVMSSNVNDGRWEMQQLAEGVYTFEEVDTPNFYSTGDISAPNDNLVPNIAVSESMNVTGIDFFDAPKDLNDDDDDDLNDDGRADDDDNHHHGDGSSSECHSIFWWLYGHCYDHVFSEHTLLGVATLLILVFIIVFFCVAAVFISTGGLADKTIPAANKRSTTPPAEEIEPRVATSSYEWDSSRKNIFERRKNSSQQQ